MSGFFDQFETTADLSQQSQKRTLSPRDQLAAAIKVQREGLERHIKSGEKPEGRTWWWRESRDELYVSVRYGNQAMEIKPGQVFIRAGTTLASVRAVLDAVEQANQAGFFDDRMAAIRKSFEGRRGRKPASLAEEVEAQGGEVIPDEEEPQIAFPKKAATPRPRSRKI